MTFKNALITTFTFLIAIQFIPPKDAQSLGGGSLTQKLPLTAPLMKPLEEEAIRSYFFKPPTDTKWNYAPGNCTFGVASFTYVPAGLGNANTWDDRARAMGYKVSTVPSVGSVAVDNSGYYGHVGLVIDKTDTHVLTREMNVRGLNSVIERWQPYSYWDSYIVF